MRSYMLSRVAESTFWMSRYIERAENVARFIDVNWHLILDAGPGQGEQWQPLIETSGDTKTFAKKYSVANRENAIQFLTFDTDNPNSILSCVRAARENARTIRDVISSEMWEQLNTFYLMLNDSHSGGRALEAPYDFFSQVRMASHLFVGITDTTMSHGEGWHFLRMGRLLERTDKTTRILDVKYYILLPNAAEVGSSFDHIQWAAVLKSASALEMYRKRFRRILPDRVVEFLLLDREFPRAALHCLSKANESLHAITGSPIGGFGCRAEQRLGQVCSDLAFADVNRMIAGGLHEYLDRFQSELNEIGEAIYETFFSLEPAPANEAPTQSQSQG